MSLINDALKRAKAAQQAAPPPPESTLHLRPAEAEDNMRHGIGYATPLIFAAVALLVLFFVWRFAQQRGSHGNQTAHEASGQAQTESAAVASDSTPLRARAREQQPTETVPAPAAASPAPASPTPTVAAPVSAPAGTNLAQIVSPSETVTNAAVAVPVAPPPLKLQGVVFNPRRPSAVISGKTVFVGDRVGAMKVFSIRSDSVTLVGGGKTNVLSLEE